MRRADRLFQIVLILRRASRPVTAARLAAELELSVRTIYRDMADLIAQQIPIRGEAGLGYVLDREFEMPPLMLSPDEIEAAVLGSRWVAMRGDPVLAAAARNLIAKIGAAVPRRLRDFATEPSIGTPPGRSPPPDGLDITKARQWIRSGHKIRLRYCDHEGRESERTVWPTIIGYAEEARFLTGWCELRQDFRRFRTDRIVAADFLDERHGCRPADLRQRWRRAVREQHGFTPE
jgi:predicted DNA-binding transcriptional regulator YafY